jgi:hypothetical protein
MLKIDLYAMDLCFHFVLSIAGCFVGVAKIRHFSNPYFASTSPRLLAN